MNEILKMLNALTANELSDVIVRANIILEKKRKEEAEAALREKERQRQERIAQERRRQEEIAALQRKLQELQNQKVEIPGESDITMGDNFIMYGERKPNQNAQAAPQKAAPPPKAAPPQPEKRVPCPHCHAMNIAGSMFCENCGRKMEAPKANPQPQAAPRPSQISCPCCHRLNSADSAFCLNCGQKLVRAQSAPQSQRTTNPAPQTNTARVRCADESMKQWEMQPGENTVYANNEIVMLHPYDRKYAYYMQVTNRRILLMRESSGSKNAGIAARMGGGLVGSLIAEGVKAATGAGPKPWLEIPLTAVSSCGLQNKKEFVIVADQTYVMKNKGYEKFLPDLVARAKNRGI